MYKRIGERIREIRELNRYSRSDLAYKANISEKYLYEIERGKKKFSADILRRIAQSLSVSCDYILFGEDATGHKNDKLVTITESMDSKTIVIVQEILKVLSEICEVL